MVRALRWAGAVLGTLAVGLLAAAGLAVGGLYGFKDRILASELSNVLRCDFRYTSSELDLLSDFPNLHLRIHNLELLSTNPELDYVPLSAEHALLEVDLRELLGSPRKRVRRIALHNVFAYLLVDSLGVNGHAFFAGYDPKRPKPEQILLDELSARDLYLVYNYLPEERGYEYFLDSLRTPVFIFPDTLEFAPQLHGRILFMREGDFRYMENMPIHLQGRFGIRKGQKLAQVSNMNLRFGGTDLKFQGTYPFARQLDYDLRFQIPDGNIEALLSLMPAEAAEQIRDLNPSGSFRFEGLVKGQDTRTENPHFELNFWATGINMLPRQAGVRLQNLTLEGIYSNGAANAVATTQVRFSKLQGLVNGQPVSAQLDLREFNDLYASGALSTRVDLARVTLPSSLGLNAPPEGILTLDLKFGGRLRHLQQLSSLREFDLEGRLDFDSLNLWPRRLPLPLQNLSGELLLNDSLLSFDNLILDLGRQQLQLNGALEGLLDYWARTRSSPLLSLTLYARGVQLDSLLALAAGMRRKPPAHTKTPHRTAGAGGLLRSLAASFPDSLDVQADLVVQNLHWRGLHLESLMANPSYHAKVLNVPDLLLTLAHDTLQASLWADGRGAAENRYALQLSFASTGLDHLLNTLAPKVLPANSLLWPTTARLNLNLNARVPRGENPQAQLDVALLPSQLWVPGRDWLLDSLQTGLNATWTGNGLDFGSMRFSPVRGRFNTWPFALNLAPDSLLPRSLNAQLATALPLPQLQKLVALPQFDSTAGMLHLNLQASGRPDALQTPDSALAWNLHGSVNLSNIQGRFVPRNLKFSQLNGQLTLNPDGHLEVQGVGLRLGGSDLALDGRIENALKLLQGNLSAAQARLKLVSDSLLLDELIQANAQASDSGFVLPRNRWLNNQLELTAEIGYLRFRRFEATQLETQLGIQQALARVNRLRFGFAGGQVSAMGQVDARGEGIKPTVDVYMRSVELSDLLYTLDNLDQDLLTDRMLCGQAELEFSFRTQLTDSLRLLLDSTRAFIKLLVPKGELRNFAPFQRLKPFIAARYLSEVSFSLSVPEIHFSNRTMQLPGLEYRSSILNMDAEGTSTVSGPIDLRLHVSPVRHRDRILQSSIIDFLAVPPRRSLLNLKIVGLTADYQIVYDWTTSSRNAWQRLWLGP